MNMEYSITLAKCQICFADYLKACLGAMVLGFLSSAAALLVWILWILGQCSSGTIMTILKIATIILLGCGSKLLV